MNGLRDYLKYYPSELEIYLFEDVHKKFQSSHHLDDEDFFTIISWKRKASAIKIAKEWSGMKIEDLTNKIYDESSNEKKMEVLTSVKEIGIAIASAILAVCYPDQFTILDYRALSSLKELEPFKCLKLPPKAENFKIPDYFSYLKICLEVWNSHSSSLREFDRSLWARDWAKGEKGLFEVVKVYLEKYQR